MNTLSLYHNLKARGVILKAEDHRLRVDAPAGELGADDRAVLRVQTDTPEAALRAGVAEDNSRRFDARRSKHPEYTSLYDPVHGKWRHFPTKEGYPSVVTLAKGWWEAGLQHDQAGGRIFLAQQERGTHGQSDRETKVEAIGLLAEFDRKEHE